jgi:hypothetical protein
MTAKSLLNGNLLFFNVVFFQTASPHSLLQSRLPLYRPVVPPPLLCEFIGPEGAVVLYKNSWCC